MKRSIVVALVLPVVGGGLFLWTRAPEEQVRRKAEATPETEVTLPDTKAQRTESMRSWKPASVVAARPVKVAPEVKAAAAQPIVNEEDGPTPEEEKVLVESKLASMDAFFETAAPSRSDYEATQYLSGVLSANDQFARMKISDLTCKGSACRFRIPDPSLADYNTVARQLPNLVASKMPQMRILVRTDERGKPEASVFLGAAETQFPAI